MQSLDTVRLQNELWKWMFRRGFDELETVYRASRAASDESHKRITDTWTEYNAKVASGEASMIEYDEGGQEVHDMAEHMGELISEIERALSQVRNAFVVSLWHYWERDLNKRMNRTEYNEERVFVYLQNRGLVPQKRDLKSLRLVANVVKHGAGRSADELLIHDPSMFDAASIARGKPSDQNLILSDATADKFFEAVRRSGP